MELRTWIKGEPMSIWRKPKTLHEWLKWALGRDFVPEEITPHLHDIHLGKWLHVFPNQMDFIEDGYRASSMYSGATHMVGIVWEKPEKILPSFRGFDLPYCLCGSFRIARIFDLSNDDDAKVILKDNPWVLSGTGVSHPAFEKFKGNTFIGEGI